MSCGEKSKRYVLIAAGFVCCTAVIVASVTAGRNGGEYLLPSVEVFAGGYQEVIDDSGVYLQLDENAALDQGSIDKETGDQTDFFCLININTASEQELMLLPGIGQVRAQAILDYRDTVGGFGAVEELLEVEGIGTGTYEKICRYCVLEGPSVQTIEEQ